MLPKNCTMLKKTMKNNCTNSIFYVIHMVCFHSDSLKSICVQFPLGVQALICSQTLLCYWIWVLGSSTQRLRSLECFNHFDHINDMLACSFTLFISSSIRLATFVFLNELRGSKCFCLHLGSRHTYTFPQENLTFLEGFV